MCDVLIVGAGPVGLNLAIDLGRREVSCRIIDRALVPLKSEPYRGGRCPASGRAAGKSVIRLMPSRLGSRARDQTAASAKEVSNMGRSRPRPLQKNLPR
jgi:2-polyprenyl-6-methoxyphenol hydroxylase-like FAD-dependent oxidoreductase